MQLQPARVVKAVSKLMSDDKADSTVVQIVWPISSKEHSLKFLVKSFNMRRLQLESHHELMQRASTT